MKIHSRFLFVVASMTLLVPVLAYGAVGDSPQNPLVVAFQGGAVTLDPIMRSENTAYSWQRHIFDTVTIRNRHGKVEPRIAVSWKDLTPLSWKLVLRKGVEFQNGTKMTAADVGKSIVDAADNPKSQMRAYVGNVKGYKVLGPHTIKVTFTHPDPFFPTHLANIPVMPEQLIKKEGRSKFDQHPIGTGPYKFVSWQADDHLVLKAWSGYWGKPPVFKNVKLVAIPNNATRVSALLSGQVQVAEKVLPQDFARLKSSGKAYVTVASGERTMYLAMDDWRKTGSPGLPAGQKNPFLSKKVREAVSLALNRKLLNEKIFKGSMTVADQFMPASMEGYAKDRKSIPYNIKKAKALLAQAGYPHGFKVRLDAPNDRYLYDSLVAEALGGMLGKIGITVNVNAIPKSVFFPNLDKGKFTMYYAGWGSTDPISTYDALFHCRNNKGGFGQVNREHYCDHKVDDIMNKAAATFDSAKRTKLEQEAYRIADAKDYAYLPLYYQNVIAGVAKDVTWKSRPDELILAWQMGRK
ncbi:MAG TPA: ABC transporter substrate-binding protein [Gammaproteobacteria bacterium]|nr:ABC transporter substrate-binding protein [Gammaproteobacteria bacterium]